MSRESHSTTSSSRADLIRAAQKVFAQRGFDGATVKDLAEQAHVNVSLVSYYFGGKEGLYRACIEEFGKMRLEFTQRVLRRPSGVEDFKTKLHVFVEEFFLIQVEQKDVCKILDRECVSDMKITRDLFENFLLKVFEALRDFFSVAQSTGILRKDLNVHVFTTLCFGALASVCRWNDLHREIYGQSLENPEYRETVIRELIIGFLRGGLA